MKSKLFLSVIVAAILSVFVGGNQISVAVQQKDSRDTLTFSNLTLEIGTAKDEYLPLEPIPIVLDLINQTKKRVAWRHAFSQNDTELFVVSFDGSVKKIDIQKPLLELIEASPHPKVFEPGGSEHFKPLVTVWLNDILSQPGNYQIQAVIHGANWSEEIKSNLLPVRIAEPEGLNKQALDYLMSEPSLFDLFAGYDLSENPKALSTLEGLAKNYSESVYGDYASFRLGELYFYKKKHRKAQEYFDKVDKNANFIFAAKLSNYLTKLKAQGARPE